MLLKSILEINLPAVIIAGVVHMGTGLLWFRPQLFGTAWTKLTGQKLKPAYRWIPAGVIGHQLIALSVAVIANLTSSATVGSGIAVGIFAWLGFIVTLETGELVWEKIPFKLFIIRISYHLLALCLVGVIVSVWR